MGKGKDLMDKSPGDFKDKPEIPEWRGEDGEGGHPKKAGEETKSVNYDR